jgi:hypothetical protein
VRRVTYLVLAASAVAAVALLAVLIGHFVRDNWRTGDQAVLEKYRQTAARCMATGGTHRSCNQYETCMNDPHWRGDLDSASNECDDAKINLPYRTG